MKTSLERFTRITSLSKFMIRTFYKKNVWTIKTIAWFDHPPKHFQVHGMLSAKSRKICTDVVAFFNCLDCEPRPKLCAQTLVLCHTVYAYFLSERQLTVILAYKTNAVVLPEYGNNLCPQKSTAIKQLRIESRQTGGHLSDFHTQRQWHQTLRLAPGGGSTPRSMPDLTGTK